MNDCIKMMGYKILRKLEVPPPSDEFFLLLGNKVSFYSIILVHLIREIKFF